MKKNILILALVFSFGNVFSQDTIVRRGAEIIVAKILEISPTEIKYKKFDFQDGPIYIEVKAGVKMVIFANGMKEIFEEQKVIVETITRPQTDEHLVKEAPVSTKIDMWGQNKYKFKNDILNEKEVQDLLIQTKDKKIISLVTSAKSAKSGQFIGFAGIPLGVGAGVLLVSSIINGNYGIFRSNSGPDTDYLAGGAVCMVAAIACPVISMTMKNKRTKCNREAIKLYNQKY